MAVSFECGGCVSVGTRGRLPRELGEAELLSLQCRVQEGSDDNEPVALPLGGLPELEVEAFPVGAITVPSGRVISPVKVPVAFVTTVIQSPLPNWMGYGVFTCM